MSHDSPTPEQVLSDPAASYWLKNALQTSLERDPCDALSDAEALVSVLRIRLSTILRADS